MAIDTPFHCDYGKNIFLGNDVIINMNCTFVDNKTIRIGDRVLIASNVQMYTSSHPVLPQERLVPDWRERKTTFFRTYARPIEIENNVWIGGGCILLPGFPTATQLGGTGRVTTLPASITLFSPIVTPGRRIQPPPIQTLFSISIGRA